MSHPSRATAQVLDPQSAGELARALGLDIVPDSAGLLSGGVSSTVVALDGRPPVVLKQALSRLRVAASWNADPARSATEADALRVFHRITPEHVPDVLASDPDAHVLAVRRAPASWRDWRTVLLEKPGDADVVRGSTAGAVLGRWHAETWDSAPIRSAFDHADAFEQLRLDPFHRELVRRGAAPADRIEPLIDELATARQCLVHGDFSPKNILVGDGLWVIDAEVAHAGAAVFDLAFLVAHLALKAVRSPGDAELLLRVAAAVLAAYETANPGRVAADSVAAHAAAVVLARVAGKSPATYLDPDQAERAGRLARRVLDDPSAGPAALWHQSGAPR